MKHLSALVVFAVVLGLATSSFADTRFGKKGTWTASGAVQFTNESESETTTFVLQPTVGNFIMNGLLIGLAPSYTNISNGSDLSTWGIAALVRYYHLMQGTLFLNAGVNLGYFGMTIDAGGNDFSPSGIGYGADAGVTLAFGGKYGGYVSLLAVFSARNLEEDNVEADTQTFGAMTELGLFF